jgi:hypothetical protein
MATTFDVVFSFDTTGSMYPCISEVRRKLSDIVDELFSNIPNLQIGLIAHGDYCDEKTTYLMKMQDFSTDKKDLLAFINNVEETGGGGNGGEAYEYVLQQSQKMSWRDNSTRSIVLIGDEPVHEINHCNNKNIEWRDECTKLAELKINVYTVQCLDWGNPKAQRFYKEVAKRTNGYWLRLEQFSYIKNILMAVCYRQLEYGAAEKYEKTLNETEFGLSKNMQEIFDVILDRDPAVNNIKLSSSSKQIKSDIIPCNGAKFQVFTVDKKCSIKEFVQEMNLTFKVGKGFYEFTKPEIISDKKEIVLMDRKTGELFEGEKTREIANIAHSEKKIKPSDIPNYRVFIQSSSYNRVLIENTGFLYEVQDFGL